MKRIIRTALAGAVMTTGLWFAPLAADAKPVPRPFGASQPVPRPGSAHTAPTPRPGFAHEKPRPIHSNEVPRPGFAHGKPRPIHSNKAAEHCGPKKSC